MSSRPDRASPGGTSRSRTGVRGSCPTPGQAVREVRALRSGGARAADAAEPAHREFLGGVHHQLPNGVLRELAGSEQQRRRGGAVLLDGFDDQRPLVGRGAPARGVQRGEHDRVEGAVDNGGAGGAHRPASQPVGTGNSAAAPWSTARQASGGKPPPPTSRYCIDPSGIRPSRTVSATTAAGFQPGSFEEAVASAAASVGRFTAVGVIPFWVVMTPPPGGRRPSAAGG